MKNILEKLNKNKKRVVTGTVLGLLVLFCAITGGIPLLILVSLVCFFGTKEYVEILKHKGFLPSLNIILFNEAAFIALIALKKYDAILFIITLGTILAFCSVLFKGKQPYIANVATTVLGAIYCAFMPVHFILIRQLNSDGMGLLRVVFNDGLGFLMLTFFVVIFTDIGAYYFGSKFGKRPLAPVISPKKTIEGSIGGTLTAIIFGIIIGWFINLPWYHSFVASLIISAAAQLGDLSESLIKRDAGVKDSGNTLPGHGGFLDRCDSFIFAAPIAYYYFKFLVIDKHYLLDLFKIFHY